MTTWRRENLLGAAPVCSVAAGLLWGLGLRGQSVTNTATADSQSEASQPQRYIMPDLAQKLADKWEINDDRFTLKFGESVVVDYTAFTQDAASISQVGKQETLPQQERIMDPFFTSRDLGLKLTHIFAGERMTFSGGGFGDWWVNGKTPKNGGADASARLTRLAWDCPDQARYFHIGISGRYVSVSDDTLRYAGRPESNVADDYVDTGDFPADHAWHLGLEALWNEGPFSVLAEYNRAWVDSPAAENPQFFGYYVLASWILTGESRPYDRTIGYAGRIIPKNHWGAPELVARFSCVDLDHGPVQGGRFCKTYFGVNCWMSRQWKLGFGWGHTWLDRFGKTGITDSFLTRIQWVF